MNDRKRRIIGALKMALLTAFIVFCFMLAPYGCMTGPMSDAEVARSYEHAAWAALAGFLFSLIFTLVTERKR